MLTQQQLRQILNYDPESGVFTWKIDINNKTGVHSLAGCIDGRGYWQIMINGKNYRAHRLAWLYVYGYMPKMIDHWICNDSALGQYNNRISNLRLATHTLNNANRSKYSNNKSGYKGVIWSKYHKKWKAFCKGKHIGFFSTPEEAAQAYDAQAVQVFGSFAQLNFP